MVPARSGLSIFRISNLFIPLRFAQYVQLVLTPGGTLPEASTPGLSMVVGDRADRCLLIDLDRIVNGVG